MKTTFKPTYLYIKRHSVTGLKYFGKTTRKNVKSYKGSGKYWKRHIKYHGLKFVETLWFQLFDNENELTEFALKFSKENNIIESEYWANLINEDGKKGGTHGPTQGFQKGHTKGFKKGCKVPGCGAKKGHTVHGGFQIGNVLAIGQFPNSTSFKNGCAPTSADIKKREITRKASLAEGEFNSLIWSIPKKQKKKITCPHCSLVGEIKGMQRWHFDNCKSAGQIVCRRIA